MKPTLKEGKQSKITENIKEIVKNFKGNEIEKISQACEWINKNLKHEREKATEIFSSRTAEEIIKDKFHTGCHDTALILTVFLRAMKIPCSYLAGIHKITPFSGHCVTKALIGEKEIIIDEGYEIINLCPRKSSFYTNYFILGEGLDSWDIGIKDFQDWKKKANEINKKLEKIKQLPKKGDNFK